MAGLVPAVPLPLGCARLSEMRGPSPRMTRNYSHRRRSTANAIDLGARSRALMLGGGRLVPASRRLVLTGGLRATAMVFKNDVTDRGVRRRHRVEAVDFVDLVVERTAHDQPHHHLDAFGAGLAHVLDVRDARELLGIARQVVEKALVPFAVDQTGARPADLVREPAGAED